MMRKRGKDEGRTEIQEREWSIGEKDDGKEEKKENKN